MTSRGRRSFLVLGLLALAAAWLGPLPRLAPQAFWAHMTMHMAVVALAAPLLALAVAGGRFDPVRRDARPFSPIMASVVELAVVWAWHMPALHHAARGSAAGLVIEQAMFFLAGLLLWLAAFGGEAPRFASRAAAGVVGLLLTSMHMTLLGALLALAQRPLYAHGTLEDQHLGGAIMLLAGGLSYLLGGLWLTAAMLRGPALAPEKRT